MSGAPPASPWRAWHIFLHTPRAIDRMLVEGVLAETRALAAAGAAFQTFFIRYWENGPHIRFRLCGLADDAFLALGGRLRARAAALAAEGGEAPTGFGAGMRFDGAEPDRAALDWHPQGSVIEVPYEPEYRRYGGPEAIAVNERLFGASSSLALAIVERTAGEPGRRQGIAMALTAAALATVTKDRPALAMLLDSMRQGWSALVTDEAAARALARRGYESARSELDAMIGHILGVGGPESRLHPMAAQWKQVVTAHLEQLRRIAARGALINPITGMPPKDEAETDFALQNIVFSQIHMMNNRLGVVPVQEYQFAEMMLLALESRQ